MFEFNYHDTYVYVVNYNGKYWVDWKTLASPVFDEVNYQKSMKNSFALDCRLILKTSIHKEDLPSLYEIYLGKSCYLVELNALTEYCVNSGPMEFIDFIFDVVIPKINKTDHVHIDCKTDKLVKRSSKNEQPEKVSVDLTKVLASIEELKEHQQIIEEKLDKSLANAPHLSANDQELIRLYQENQALSSINNYAPLSKPKPSRSQPVKRVTVDLSKETSKSLKDDKSMTIADFLQSFNAIYNLPYTEEEVIKILKDSKQLGSSNRRITYNQPINNAKYRHYFVNGSAPKGKVPKLSTAGQLWLEKKLLRFAKFNSMKELPD